MAEIWTKDIIKSLGMKTKEMWFDVLNNGLEEDRGFSLDDPNLLDIQKQIKEDYINYLDRCVDNLDFLNYYILRNEDGVIVSLCRIIIRDERYFVEGLETHRDHYRKGYARQLLDFVIKDLFRKEIERLYSNVAIHNDASNKFHLNFGFGVLNENSQRYVYSLDINKYVMTDLFNNWASTYNESVRKSEEEGSYPFAGYSNIKLEIFKEISRSNKKDVLDMGVGTGEITGALYDLGYNITGIDFSSKMIELAQKKMPNAKMIQSSFLEVTKYLDKKYDYIIFNYSIHHLEYDKQVDLLANLYDYLNNNGIILIGDVSTMNDIDMGKLRNKYISIWDDEEYYPIASKYTSHDKLDLYQFRFVNFNEVAGLFYLRKDCR